VETSPGYRATLGPSATSLHNACIGDVVSAEPLFCPLLQPHHDRHDGRSQARADAVRRTEAIAWRRVSAAGPPEVEYTLWLMLCACYCEGWCAPPQTGEERVHARDGCALAPRCDEGRHQLPVAAANSGTRKHRRRGEGHVARSPGRQVASSGVHLGKPIACGADCSRPRLSWRAVGPGSSEEDRLRGNVVRLSFHACRIAATSPPATRLNKPRRGYRPSWLLVTSLLHRATNVNMIAMPRLVRATTTAPHPPHRPHPYLTRRGLIHSLPCHHTSDTTHLCCHSHTSPPRHSSQ
jgi:hypothetical protein